MKKKILIVDDDQDILDVISIVMENTNYEVETSLSGKLLLEPLTNPPDLILLDKRLTGLDGLDICRHLKSQQDTKDIPVIIISAVPDLEKLALAAGADDFIEKPFNIRELYNKVEKQIA